MPKGFYALILAQFASGLADNALMILGVFFLQEQGYPAWWAPLLKFFFTLSYVLLASVVGPLTDAFPKGRVMAIMNTVKLGGVVLLVLGLHPLAAFALIGMAAAVYAPAKYGLVTESVPASHLVRANAWLEVSVVMSVLLGVALGGYLIGWSDRSDVSMLSVLFGYAGMTTRALDAFALVLLVYVISALLNAGLGTMGSAGVQHPLHGRDMRWSVFWRSNLQLWRDPLGGVSLYVTTLSWGVGAVLQFAVLTWAQNMAGLSLQQGAYLQALVAIGVILGALRASRRFQLFNARKAMAWGLLLAALLPLMSLIRHVEMALPLLITAGFSGGMLLVPMNALLQHRGQKMLTPGRSIAVQGFNENLSVLLMLGVYSAFLAVGMHLGWIMLLLTLPLLAAVWPLGVKFWQKQSPKHKNSLNCNKHL
jgi:LPLT family lysophospholipid transporter-like MFS transporter